MSSDDMHTLKITEHESVYCESDECSSPLTFSHVSESLADDENRFYVLKDLEESVTNFKTRALLLEDEKESLLSSLMAFKNDHINKLTTGGKDELIDITEGLTNMLLEVDLKVTTNRNNHEEEALHHINSIINHLVLKVQHGAPDSRYQCYEFMKSCFRLGSCTAEEILTINSAEADLGGISFQSIIGKCTVDDKYRVGRRLRGLLNYIESHHQLKHDYS